MRHFGASGNSENLEYLKNRENLRFPSWHVRPVREAARPAFRNWIARKFKNAELSGFLDDFISKAKKTISKEGQKVIDKNKDKIIQAATTQATNIIGKQLDSLSKKNPKAEAAISKVVATATQAATAQAQSSITEKAKEVFEQNKKYILLAGGGALALIALSMYMKKKA